MFQTNSGPDGARLATFSDILPNESDNLPTVKTGCNSQGPQ